MKLPGDFHVHTCMRPVDDGAEEMTPAAVAAAMRSRSFGAFGLSPHFHFDSDFGAVCAFASGLLSLFILKKLVIASKWWFFGIYCLIAGLSAIGVTYLGAW